MEMRLNDSDLRSACREVLNTIPETLETRLVRTVLGSYWDEFESRGENWQDHAKRRWEKFIASTGEEIISQWPDASALLAALGSLHQRLKDLGAQPDFWPLSHRIAEAHRQLALEAAKELLRQPTHPLGALLDAFVISTTEDDLALRMQLCESAIETESEELIVGAVGCFTFWRQHSELPPRALELLAYCARNATPWVANSIIRFVWLNDSQAVTNDWQLLAALPAGPEAWFIARGIMEQATHLLEESYIPTPEIADAILGKLDGLDSLSGHEIKHGLEAFAKHFPGKVFLLVWRRQTRHPEGKENFELIPFDFDHIRLDGLMGDPEAETVVRSLEDRLLDGAEMRWDETQLLQIAVLQSRADVESHLMELVRRAVGAKQLLRICEFVTLWHHWPIVLSCPQFTKALLEKAKATGEEIYLKISRKLQNLPGSRGSSAYRPDEDWNALLGAVEKMAETYKGDAELGALYAAAAKHERDFMKDMCRRIPDEEDLLDE